MDERPTFFVDAMLGSLARWLRIMGYDVKLADNELADEDILLLLAEEGGRILLTRDKMLASRSLSSGMNALLIDFDSLDKQMFQLSAFVALDATQVFSCCPRCGALLTVVSKDEAKQSGMVPKGSLQNSERFWRCPSCGRYYWKGSHWPRIIEQLRRWRIAVDNSFIEGE